jgi:hypothetical protein
MSVVNKIREPFTIEQVRTIVTQKRESGTTDDLLERVTLEVRLVTGIVRTDLPERIGTWIRREVIRSIDPSIEQKPYSALVSSPIDLASIPGRVV